LGLTLSDWPTLWVVLYAATGFAAGLRYTIAESWVPALAGPDARGRAVALFQTIVGASSFIGAGALLLTGSEGLLPRALAVVATLIGVVVLWPIEAPAQAGGEASFALNWSSLRGLVGQVGPAVLGAALIGGLFESGLSVALPLFGLAIGLGPALAAGLVTALGLGSLAQYPFGALADRFPWRSVALGTAGMIALSALLLPFATGWPWLLLVLGVVWGSAGGGLYTLAVISNSNRWRGKQLVGVSVVTQFAYMIGEAGGPALGGLAIDLAPQYGLPILVGVSALSGLALLLGAPRVRAEAPRGAVPAADAVQA
jgi:MFS family permease